jgi:hypothetical protein
MLLGVQNFKIKLCYLVKLFMNFTIKAYAFRFHATRVTCCKVVDFPCLTDRIDYDRVRAVAFGRNSVAPATMQCGQLAVFISSILN